MIDTVELLAEPRSALGTGNARAIRNRGMVPAVVYGAGKPSMNISIEGKEITKCYKKQNFISTVLLLNVDGVQHKVLPKAVELHPVSDAVRHVDFVHLDNKMQKMEVPIIYEGKDKAIGVKRGGYFNTVLRKITLLCPVDNLPTSIVVDVTNVAIGKSVTIDALKIPEGCQIVGKPNKVIASIIGKGGKTDAEEAAAATAAK